MSTDDQVRRRQELYNEVWAEPMRDLAKKYGMSDVGLAKICKKLKIPRPERGYWNRKNAGKKTRKKPLPSSWTCSWNEHWIFERLKKVTLSQFGNEATAYLLREENPAMAIIVPQELLLPHKLIKKSAGVLRRKSTSQNEVRLQRPCLDITARRAVLERALVIMDTILKAFEVRGFQVKITIPNEEHGRYRPKASKTGVTILGSFIEFGIEEGIDIRKVGPKSARKHSSGFGYYAGPPEYKHVPNGTLALKLKSHLRGQSRQTWADGKRQRVETCLQSFVKDLILGAERERLFRVDEERKQKAREKEQKRIKEEVRVRELEIARQVDLKSRVAHWGEAAEILQFLDAYEAAAISKCDDISPESEIGIWLAWARGHAIQLREIAMKTECHAQIE